MGKNLYRVGDLVITHKSYNPSADYYCKIIDIIDSDGVYHYEYDIITGYGDLNSKVKLNLLAIGVDIEYKTEIIILDEVKILSNIDTHNVHLRSPDKLIKNAQQEIIRHNKNIDFFEKNKNIIELRDDKITKILENKINEIYEKTNNHII